MTGHGAPTAPTLRLLPMGDAALLLETDDIDAVLAIAAVLGPLAATGDGIWAEVDDLVPAARTLLVAARPRTDLAELARAVLAAAGAASLRVGGAGGRVIEIPVRYDGVDLDEVAGLIGLTRDEVVAAHTGTPWRVGSAASPRFRYLVGGDPREVARHAEPCTRPAELSGSWAVAASTRAVARWVAADRHD